MNNQILVTGGAGYRAESGDMTQFRQKLGSCPPISPIIVAGERRYKAAQQAGLLAIPGICVEGNASEIARKKQIRGMQTAYEKYKEKVAKAAEGRTKQEKEPETAADVMMWLSKSVNKLNGLDTSFWTEDEKGTFNQALIDFHDAIGNILNLPASSNLA